MSEDNTGAVRAYSDAAFSRGVVVGGEERPAPSTQPSALAVESTTIGTVGGADLDKPRPGILATVRDKTGESLIGRDIRADDTITITTPSGREMTVPVRIAEREGFLFRDSQGQYREADRQAQIAVVEEMAQLERSRREAEAHKYDPAVEEAVRQISDAMSAEGLDFSDSFAEFIGSDGEYVSEPVAKFGNAHGLDMKAEMHRYVWQLRSAVEDEVLAPQGIDVKTFLSFLELNRGPATRAAVLAHNGRSLDGFKQLARLYRDTGWMTKQPKRKG